MTNKKTNPPRLEDWLFFLEMILLGLGSVSGICLLIMKIV